MIFTHYGPVRGILVPSVGFEPTKPRILSPVSVPVSLRPRGLMYQSYLTDMTDMSVYIGTRGGIRTPNAQLLRLPTLPIGLLGHIWWMIVVMLHSPLGIGFTDRLPKLSALIIHWQKQEDLNPKPCGSIWLATSLRDRP